MSARVMFRVTVANPRERGARKLGVVRALPSSDLLEVVNPPETLAREVLQGFPYEGTLWVPDRSQVRSWLPHNWRAAWDRNGGRLWYTSMAGVELTDTPHWCIYAYASLTCARGITRTGKGTLATVYFEPYLLAP